MSCVELSTVLRKLHDLDPDQSLYVSCTETTTVSELTGLLTLVQETGLKTVMIATPAFRNGKSGTQYITMTINPLPQYAPSCTGDFPLDRGFLPDPDPSELTEVNRKRPAKPLLRRRCATPTLGE
jgi:hypothetical protein